MITSIARTSWLNLRRDRAAAVLSFVVPLVFFSIFAGIFAGQRNSTSKVRVAIADEDRSPESKKLIDALARESSLEVRRGPDSKQPAIRFDARSVDEYVRKGSAPAAIVIPKGYGAAPFRFGGTSAGPRFRILADSSDPVASNVISGMLQKVVMTAAPASMIRAGTRELDRWSGGLTAQQKSTIEQNISTFEKRPAAEKGSGGTIVGIDVVDVLGKSKKNPIVAFYAAGIGVMFLLFTASNAGGALLEEAESGTLDRILSTRVTFTQLLLGKGLYLWTLAVTQLTVMFLWGALVFGLELRSHLAGFVLMTAATAVATSAFGLLLAALANTRQQLGAISTLVVLSISALGGSMFPRFLMPAGLQKVGLVLFNAWAIEGFTRVFWREEPLSSLAVPILVLLAFGVAFFAIARRLARRWEVA
ncbi:MAG: ABC transporter permease [Acidobacteria bacterium]|nr:MAG: ABC transporter permease [Acidobacteriota bacterium]